MTSQHQGAAERFVEHFSFLASNDAAAEALRWLSSRVQHVERRGHELVAVVSPKPDEWYLLLALPPNAERGRAERKPVRDDLDALLRHHGEFTLARCLGATSLESALALEAEVREDLVNEPFFSFDGPGWCEPWEWLEALALEHAIDPAAMEQVTFVLGTAFGCYFLSTREAREHRRLVFVDRDAPEHGLRALFGQPDVPRGEPHAIAALAELPIALVCLCLVRWFLGVDKPQTEFDLVLTHAGPNKTQVMKDLRALLRLELQAVKALVDELPATLKRQVTREEAERVKALLVASGASVEVR